MWEVAHTRAARVPTADTESWSLAAAGSLSLLSRGGFLLGAEGGGGSWPRTSEDASPGSALICCVTLGKPLHLSEPLSTTKWTNLSELLGG